MTTPLRPQSAERPALQKFRTALNALYLEVEPSIANDIVALANAAITEAEAYARAAEEQEQDRNLFWPPEDEFEEHIYEIRNGKTADYVRAHALALAGTFAGVGESPAAAPQMTKEELAQLHNFADDATRSALELADTLEQQKSKRIDVLLDDNCIETIKRLTPAGGEEISFGGVMGGIRLLWRAAAPAAPLPQEE